MNINNPPRPIRLFPYFLILVTLGLLVWASVLQMRHPVSGANWVYTTGLVDLVEPGSPASSFLKVGDRIVEICRSFFCRTS